MLVDIGLPELSTVQSVVSTLKNSIVKLNSPESSQPEFLVMERSEYQLEGGRSTGRWHSDQDHKSKSSIP